jgi:hypothetical protein
MLIVSIAVIVQYGATSDTKGVPKWITVRVPAEHYVAALQEIRRLKSDKHQPVSGIKTDAGVWLCTGALVFLGIFLVLNAVHRRKRI